MDFVVGLPRTPSGNDTIWVIVDRLTKSTHFLAIKLSFFVKQLAAVYASQIVRYHGIPNISDLDSQFTSKFWKSVHQAMGTKLNFSTTFHPQMDRQFEWTIQTLKDMLRACTLDFQGEWDKKLPLIELFYNNSYHASIGMAPYEALCGRKCRSLVHWYKTREKELVSTDFINRTTDDVKSIRQRMEIAHSR